MPRQNRGQRRREFVPIFRKRGLSLHSHRAVLLQIGELRLQTVVGTVESLIEMRDGNEAGIGLRQRGANSFYGVGIIARLNNRNGFPLQAVLNQERRGGRDEFLIAFDLIALIRHVFINCVAQVYNGAFLLIRHLRRNVQTAHDKPDR